MDFEGFLNIPNTNYNQDENIEMDHKVTGRIQTKML